MAATHKAQALVRVLAENLKLRTGLAVTTGVDASGNPTIALGAGTAGSQSAFVRIKQDYDPALELDGIGNTQRRYTPHVTQVVLETSTVANVPLLTIANMAKIQRELTEMGTAVEFYLTANTTAVTVAGITGTPAVRVDSLWHPMTSTI